MSDSSKSTVNWSLFCHLSGLLLFSAIPLLSALVPLLIWKFKQGADSTLESSGREAVNYNLSMWVYVAVAGLLCMVMVGYALIPLLFLAHLILVIQAVIKASRGEAVRYPFTLRFIK